ncbi:DUF4166 domain-containing protein [Nocardiopsis composta]|uniref:DUF4166 domain-containing protein n=1 Tax=Nocardiopsis composta TaxID=157465 RepID=A0A7W8QJB0_9ACTN|nr:DUF4166 domain-containing protein [Nocardiopsis composta]MBB5430818.1 hypothetical protein [Nocardiopsis composta]
MTSLFQRAMGDGFDLLHPRLRERFSAGADTGTCCIGRGTMDRIWHGGAAVRLFLALGAVRNILVPRAGRDVPFVIENVPYTDALGREAVTFVRTFRLPGRPRRFDATMVYSPERGCIVDYLGTHQHLACDLFPEPDGRGGLVIRSGPLRFREGPLDVGVPAALGGTAEVRERYDERTGRFRISVRVGNPLLGPVFGYQGSFTTEHPRAAGRPLPAHLCPTREEARA